METKQENSKDPILWMVFLGLLVVLFGAGSFTFLFQKHHLDEMVKAQVTSVQTLFQDQLRSEAEFLTSQTLFIGKNSVLQGAMKRKNKDELLRESDRFFKDESFPKRITHWYFTLPDGINLLRVHDPEHSGGQINRWTQKQAMKTGESSWGIELGPLGTFTLRVVKPWKADGQMLGYIELGMEIDHLIPRLQQQLGGDILVVIEKQFIDPIEGRRHYGNDWNRFDDFVVINRTFPIVPLGLDTHLHQHEEVHHHQTFPPVVIEGKYYEINFLPLLNVRGKEVGDLIVLVDVTKGKKSLRILLWWLGGGGGVSVLLVMIFLNLRVGRVVERLEDLIFTQSVLYRLIELGVDLKVSEEDILREFLQFNTEVSWFNLQKQGLIFEVTDEGLRRLVTFGNLHPTVVEKCDNICGDFPCLCGIIARAHLEGDTDGVSLIFFPPGTEPHGHWFLVIRMPKRALVVNFYTNAEYRPSPHDEQYLRAAGQALSRVLQLRQVMQDVEDAKDVAEEALRAKEEFLANMSHEMRTPLTSIIGQSVRLIQRWSRLSETDRQGKVETIHQASERLKGLIDQLFDLVDLQSGNAKIEPSEFLARDFLTSIQQEADPLVEASPLSSIVLGEIPDMTIEADRSRLHQIVMNQVVNATKYAQRGKVTLSVQQATIGANTPALKIFVRDTGVGIPDALKERVFSRFEQGDHAGRKAGGRGLGLAISERLVRLHGGRIWVENTPRGGATFVILLPQRQVTHT